MERGSLTLEWSIDALSDLDRFAAFLSERGDAALAAAVAAELTAKSRLLADQPLIGRPVDKKGVYRQVVLGAMNSVYVLYYRIAGERIVVLRVFHSREDRT